MLLESRMVVSVLALSILLLSFVASFKHQNSVIFIVGLLVCLLLTRCDDWAPGMRQAMSKFSAKETPESPTQAPTQAPTPAPTPAPAPAQKPVPKPVAVKLAPVVPPPPPAKQSAVSKENVSMSGRYDDPPTDFDPNVQITADVAEALFTNNISYLEKQGTEVLDDRPRMGDFVQGKASGTDLLKLVPDFPTMGHLLVGTLRAPDEPQFKVDLDAAQNPEVKSLEKYGLLAGPDYFPNCKTGSVTPTSVGRDARDTSRCNRPGMY